MRSGVMQEREAALEELDVANNGISEEGAAALAALLAARPLKRLNANMNALGNGGMYKLADALKDTPALEELDLGGNNVGPEGAAVLMNALQGKQSLKTLELGCAASHACIMHACASFCDSFAHSPAPF
jgi:NLR family CARD domain-containing protein 3